MDPNTTRNNKAGYSNKRQQPVNNESITITEAIGYVYFHKWLFITSMAICVFLGVLYIWKTPKTYLRTATIMIKDSSKGIKMDESEDFKDIISIGSYSVENQLALLKSKRLTYLTAEKLGLNISYYYDNLKKTELYKSSPILVEYKEDPEKANFSFTAKIINNRTVRLTEKDTNWDINCTIGEYTKTPWGEIKILLNHESDLKPNNGRIIHVSVRPMQSAASSYYGRVTAEITSKESSIVTLSLVDGNTRKAEDFLNTLVEVYAQDCIEDKQQLALNSANLIKERLSILENDLDTIDSRIEEYKKDNRLTTIETESSIYMSSSNAMDMERMELENQLNMVKYMKDYLHKNIDNTDMIPPSISFTDAGIQQQINSYNNLITQKIKILSNSSNRNPLVLDINKTLITQRGALNEALSNLSASILMKIKKLNEKEQEYIDKITDLPTQHKELISIQRQQKTKENLYLYLLNKREENDLQQSIIESTCKIVDPANGSNAPISPKKPQIILISLIVGIIIPAVWLYVRMLLDTKVRYKEDIKGKTSIPFIGELPYDKEKELSNINEYDNNAHEIFVEALRIIRENINFMLSGNNNDGKVLQVLSTAPAAGKTFVTISLAATYASTNKRVIILDLDLRKMSLTRRFNISTKKMGLSNYLAGESINIESIIHNVSTQSGDFDVIASGQVPPNPAELLKEQKLDDLIAYLRTKYDYIICDNPPYGIVVDAFVSSRFSDASIYVVRSGLFDKRWIRDLQELYNSNKLKKMSLLLNGVDIDKARKKYNYRYGYRQGYYAYEYGDSKNKERGFISRNFFNNIHIKL